jgi:ADP-ribosylglycohydrolase/predicted enzyme related to lactoylglutathione lyase
MKLPTGARMTGNVPLLAKARGAFLGAAVGDALGWPYEQNAKRLDKQKLQTVPAEGARFVPWTRREGHPKFFGFEVEIRPGEYSDDTQLLLSVARSRLSAGDWWQRLALVELPMWTLYGRGGGGATKRAAQCWLEGKAPWESVRQQEVRQSYFQAGGNGVVMRILPHCLMASRLSDFAPLAEAIVADGVCTHGHPRALVGALAYGFALWTALRQPETLSYGQLIETTLQGINQWSSLPDITTQWPDWRSAAEAEHADEYQDSRWNEAVSEMGALLEVAQQALQQGALVLDHQVMEQLGCFDRSRNGAGTITAATAIFLSSMHAADPMNGVTVAAYAPNADTDTTASTTGALLGAIAGSDWLGTLAREVQDSDYLCTLADRLYGDEKVAHSVISPVSRRTLKTASDRLDRVPTGQQIKLPDGRHATLQETRDHRTLSGRGQAKTYVLRTDDGQTVFLVNTKKESAASSLVEATPSKPVRGGRDSGRTTAQMADIVAFRVRLLVSNMQRACDFYSRVLGFAIKQSQDATVVADAIVLAPQSGTQQNGRAARRLHSDPTGRALLFEVRNIRSLYDSVRIQDGSIVKQLTQQPRREFFRCVDPDGNVIELFERSETSSSTAMTAPDESESKQADVRDAVESMSSTPTQQSQAATGTRTTHSARARGKKALVVDNETSFEAKNDV